jgi:cysteine synthase
LGTLPPTPLIRRDAVSSALGLDVWLKCENLLPTAAFKVRGGLNLIGRDPTAKAGVIGASTGNHGQSLAYAGWWFGVPVTIVVPKGANPLKVGGDACERRDDRRARQRLRRRARRMRASRRRDRRRATCTPATSRI